MHRGTLSVTALSLQAPPPVAEYIYRPAQRLLLLKAQKPLSPDYRAAFSPALEPPHSFGFAFPVLPVYDSFSCRLAAAGETGLPMWTLPSGFGMTAK